MIDDMINIKLFNPKHSNRVLQRVRRNINQGGDGITKSNYLKHTFLKEHSFYYFSKVVSYNMFLAGSLNARLRRTMDNYSLNKILFVVNDNTNCFCTKIFNNLCNWQIVCIKSEFKDDILLNYENYRGRVAFINSYDFVERDDIKQSLSFVTTYGKLYITVLFMNNNISQMDVAVMNTVKQMFKTDEILVISNNVDMAPLLGNLFEFSFVMESEPLHNLSTSPNLQVWGKNLETKPVEHLDVISLPISPKSLRINLYGGWVDIDGGKEILITGKKIYLKNRDLKIQLFWNRPWRYFMKHVEKLNLNDCQLEKLFDHIHRQPYIKHLTRLISTYYYLMNIIFHKSKGLSHYNNKNLCCIFIGDSKYSLCSKLFSILTDWAIVSIDPVVEADPEYNISFCKELCEDVDYEPLLKTFSEVLVVSIHGHGDLNIVWRKIQPLNKNLIMVSNPCCHPYRQLLKAKIPHSKIQARFKKIDDRRLNSMFSPQNRFLCWTNKYDD